MMVFCSYQSTDLIPYIHRIFLPYFPQILKPPSWIPYNPHKNGLKLVKTKQDWLKVQAEPSLCGRHDFQISNSSAAELHVKRIGIFCTDIPYIAGHFLDLYCMEKHRKKIYRLLHDKFPVLRQRISRNVISHLEKKKQLSPSAVLFLLCTVRN